MSSNGQYNDGNVHLDFYNQDSFALNEIATEFSEGNNYLKEALLSLWESNIKTMACCIGHEDDFQGNMLFIDDETGRIVKKTVGVDEAKLAYIALIIDESNYDLIGQICDSLLSEFKDKISIRLGYNQTVGANCVINCSSSVKDSFFSHLAKYCKTEEKNNSSIELVKFAYLLGKSFYRNVPKDDSKSNPLFSYFNICIDCEQGHASYQMYLSSKYVDLIDDVVKEDGFMIFYVLDAVYNRPDIIFNAVKQNINVFFRLKPADVINYSELALYVVEQKPSAFIHINPNTVHNYYDIALAALSKDCSLIKYVPGYSPYYFSIALEIVKTHPEIVQSLEYGVPSIKAYNDILYAAYNIDKNSINLIPADKSAKRNYKINFITQDCISRLKRFKLFPNSENSIDTANKSGRTSMKK